MQTTLDLEGLPPRAAILSHRPLVREYFAGVIRRAGMEVVGSFSGGADARRGLRILPADILIADLAGGADVFALAAEVAGSVQCRVIGLSQAVGDYMVYRAQAAGIAGLLSELDDGEIIVAGINMVARGGRFLSPSVSRLQEEFRVMAKLTAAELRVLPLACKGTPDEAIAAQLGLAARTVETQRTSAMRKIGVVDAAGLFTLGIRMGVVAADEIDVASRERRTAARGRVA